MTIDPYKTLNIKKNYTIDELKKAYLNMIMIVHPDRGGNEYMFKLVTKCYKYLLDKKNNVERDHIELKTIHKENKFNNINYDSTMFNINKFNEIFEIHNDKESEGYADFLKKDIPEQEYSKKITMNNFNEIFENQAVSKNKYIARYREPEPVGNLSSCSYVVLGESSVDDYSSDLLQNSLRYSDLKIAHTTSRIIDPSTVKNRKTYNSMEDIKMDRQNLKYTMDDHDKEYYEKKKQIEIIKEKNRLKRLTDEDRLSEKKYNDIMKLFKELK